MTQYLNCIPLINEGIASFEEYSDWCQDEEVSRWMDYSYKVFPNDGIPGKRNGTGERQPGVNWKWKGESA